MQVFGINIPIGQPQKKQVVVPKVNLFPEDPFFETVIGKGLRWSVSVGRHIVIFTELVVIGSFFSRFVLDRQLTDLNREIIQRQAIVESYDDLEPNVRAIQARTEDVAAILNQQGRYEVLEAMTRLTPSDVRYDTISLRDDRLTLSGKVRSNRSLEVFLNNLKSYPDFESVSVGGITSGDERDPAITFSISLTYTKGSIERVESTQNNRRPSNTDEDEL